MHTVTLANTIAKKGSVAFECLVRGLGLGLSFEPLATVGLFAWFCRGNDEIQFFK